MQRSIRKRQALSKALPEAPGRLHLQRLCPSLRNVQVIRALRLQGFRVRHLLCTSSPRRVPTNCASLSAWYLKQFVFDDLKENELDCDIVPISPVMKDYGFEHCETIEDFEGLKAVYRVLLKHTSCQPPDLHRACIEGRLYEYVSSLVRMDDKEKYKQWMAAPNPLPWGYALCCPRELRLGH
ncbi:hypothetical protein HYPSUDRAFT_1081302 [Hypholoma sublateritium FD-334 SS-4]|uniref:Uncharacterized protein n=1 Tax=Hypholoma sublateritium (strain FD-334 SS-4) TaxID=945553 RepID=A0A0D2NWY2_HYPSF|nr:hypothetical protein HYPSUDRAFT_1081302 [Hypholoma sublateritium FD-334 SS-4]